MVRRILTTAAAVALSTAALVGAATPASADPTCNTQVGGTLTWEICVEARSVSWHYVTIPFSVGPICVGTTCTGSISDSVTVPVPDTNPATVYGTVCVTIGRFPPSCRSFNTDVLAIGPINL